MRAVTSQTESESSMDLHQASHPATVLAALQTLRLDRRFTDVVLKVEGKDFHCHKNVLTASSAYFKSMFSNDMKESREDIIGIKGVASASMELILDYVYTSRVTITSDNVQGLLGSADLLQLIPVRMACQCFLEKQIHASNCFGIYLLAEQHSCTELSRKAWSFALQNFPRVCSHGEILEQTPEVLVKYFSSDELVVDSETDVCETILKWTLADLLQRQHQLHALLTHLRSHLLPRKYLTDKMAKNELMSGFVDANKLLGSSYGGSEIFVSRKPSSRPTRSRKVIVVVGGVGPANTKLRDLKFYDPADRKWGTLTRLPASADSVSGVNVVANDIYVTGFRGEVYAFRTMSGWWDTLASSEIEAGTRQRRGSAVLGGFVYLIGGFDGAVRLARVDRFDTKTKEWDKVGTTTPVSSG